MVISEKNRKKRTPRRDSLAGDTIDPRRNKQASSELPSHHVMTYCSESDWIAAEGCIHTGWKMRTPHPNMPNKKNTPPKKEKETPQNRSGHHPPPGRESADLGLKSKVQVCVPSGKLHTNRDQKKAGKAAPPQGRWKAAAPQKGKAAPTYKKWKSISARGEHLGRISKDGFQVAAQLPIRVHSKLKRHEQKQAEKSKERKVKAAPGRTAPPHDKGKRCPLLDFNPQWRRYRCWGLDFEDGQTSGYEP